MRFLTMWYVRPAKAQTRLRYAQSDQSLCSSLEYSLTVQLLTELHLKFLSLKGWCSGLSMSTLFKMPHCWKSHVTAHIFQLLAMAFYISKQCSHIWNVILCGISSECLLFALKEHTVTPLHKSVKSSG